MVADIPRSPGLNLVGLIASLNTPGLIVSEGDDRLKPDSHRGHVISSLLSALPPGRIGNEYALDAGDRVHY